MAMRHTLAIQCPPGSIGYHTRDNYRVGDSEVCAYCEKPILLAADPDGEGEPGWHWIRTIRIVEWP